jgi:hypothetical protein
VHNFVVLLLMVVVEGFGIEPAGDTPVCVCGCGVGDAIQQQQLHQQQQKELQHELHSMAHSQRPPEHQRPS